MQRAPQLTLITITKDDVDGLARTLASAAKWRAAGAEHIVIDGSAETRPTTRAETAEAGHVTIISRPARGVADAFNTGLAEATGEWVWFLNGGDQIDGRLTPEFLFALLNNTRADVIVGGITYGTESEPRQQPPGELQWPPLQSWISHPSTLVRRRLFGRFGRFDERYTIAMDYEWWLRVFSSAVPADVLTVPFAVFAPGGMSQQPASMPRIASERDDAIRRHQKYLWRAWLSAGFRLVRAWLTALFARRLRVNPRTSGLTIE